LIIRAVSDTELGPKLVRLVCTAHLSAEGGCPQIEGIGRWPGGRWRIEAEAGAPVPALGVVLLLLLLLCWS